MNEDQFEQFMLDYIDGTISDENLALLKTHLLNSEMSLDDLDEMRSLGDKLGSISIPEMSQDFNHRLNHIMPMHQKKIVPFSRLNYLKVAIYTLVIFGAGAMIGNTLSTNNQDQTDQIKNVVLDALNQHQASPASQIQAALMSSTLVDIDNSIIDALLETLNTEPNVNVRLSALHALSKFSDHDRVRAGVVQSILNQDSPVVQIALLNIMIDWREKSSIDYFTKLMERENTDMLVISEIESGLEKI